ncbi:MAG TPA: flagellar motor protein MotB, partial [Acidimicrobiia bacterium]|nr:flagellar motor protein MotB [Acidimicrobiia bacterium]
MATASAKSHRRSKLHEEHEEHVNHERWLITYADMITLLMVLFIVLYSISQVDLAKFRRLKEGVAGGEEREQLLLNDPRVGTGLDGKDAFHDELHVVGLDLAHPLQLVPDR